MIGKGGTKMCPLFLPNNNDGAHTREGRKEGEGEKKLPIDFLQVRHFHANSAPLFDMHAPERMNGTQLPIQGLNTNLSYLRMEKI